ncbi:MAG: leucine-rich repeat protein, partial [Thermoguttaceae bacterium]|nr:leucine-rich repeat protein [Thermoguttaceae bacterium]
MLTIAGSGEMGNFKDWIPPVSPWYDYCEKIIAVSLPDGLTSIGYKAFWNCSALTSVTIPDSVTRI